MSDKPILFSGSMVCALIEGRKTQTRRVLKKQPISPLVGFETSGNGYWAGIAKTPDVKQQYITTWPFGIKCPYGRPGDLLWVRETWTEGQDGTDCGAHRWPIYAAEYRDGSGAYKLLKPWKPSLFMPRKYSRLTLELTEVRVERLWEITEGDSLAEGIDTAAAMFNAAEYDRIGMNGSVYREKYRKLWESINGPGSWAENPWLWCLSFRVHLQNIDRLIEQRKAA